MARHCFEAVSHLIVADLGRDSLTSSTLLTYDRVAVDTRKAGVWEEAVPLSATDQFDIISCQFAMHYMFQVKHKC
jgi:hypothetical protein